VKGFQAKDGGWIAKFTTLDAGNTALCNFPLPGCQDKLAAFHVPEARTLGGFTEIYAGYRHTEAPTMRGFLYRPIAAPRRLMEGT
jgi:hypothetical protein